MEMKDLSCAQFLAQLASKAPTPGGGGTAALAGAAGVALGNMVGCLTTGKKKYAAVEADIQALNARASALRLELEALVQADADAFAPLAAAYGLPKDTPEQAAHKAAVLEAALDGASAVPLQIMEKCAEGIALAGQYAAKGSVLAVSDAGCAAVLCKAALQAASLNVFINTNLMADRTRAAALDARADALLAEFVPRAERYSPPSAGNSATNNIINEGKYMATILKGAPVVAAMNERNAALCEQLKAKGITPTLAVVRVGEREDDLSYERGVMTRCGKVGVAVRQFVLPADATQEQLLRVLDEVNTDNGIHGCLLFRPLPKQFDDRTVRAALRPEKDIDGITDASLAGVFTNTDLGYAPCTAQACMEILKYYNVPLSGKRAVVVGRSLVVGKPAAMMLDRENATVTLCNSRTRNLPEVCRQADIVVVAMGKMGAVGADCLREGQTVVDVGIHVNEEGKLCGDVQFAAAEPVVDAITPVPGGVGTVTTSVLVGHVVQAACKKAGVEC